MPGLVRGCQRVLGFLLGLLDVIFQCAHHFHNGGIHALLPAAVVHIIVAVHHAEGNGIQFSGVFAQLLHHIAGNEGGYENAAKHGHRAEPDDDIVGVVIALLHLLYAERGQFRAVGLNLAELLAQNAHVRASLAYKIHVCLGHGDVVGRLLHNNAHGGPVVGRAEAFFLLNHGRLHLFQGLRSGIKLLRRGAQGQAAEHSPQSVELKAQFPHSFLVVDSGLVNPMSEHDAVNHGFHGIKGSAQSHAGLIGPGQKAGAGLLVVNTFLQQRQAGFQILDAARYLLPVFRACHQGKAQFKLPLGLGQLRSSLLGLAVVPINDKTQVGGLCIQQGCFAAFNIRGLGGKPVHCSSQVVGSPSQRQRHNKNQ